MLRKRFAIIVTSLTLLSLVFGGWQLLQPSVAQAADTSSLGTRQKICEGISATGGDCSSQAATSTINNILSLALNTLSFIAGIIGVVMIIIGGIKYVTSQGDASSINSAKNTILYALVGLVIAVMAQFLVRFVLHNTQQATDTTVQPNTANTQHAPDAGQ